MSQRNDTTPPDRTPNPVRVIRVHPSPFATASEVAHVASVATDNTPTPFAQLAADPFSLEEIRQGRRSLSRAEMLSPVVRRLFSTSAAPPTSPNVHAIPHQTSPSIERAPPQSPFALIKTLPKSVVRTPIESVKATDVVASCETVLANITTHGFKQFASKLKLLCSKATKPCAGDLNFNDYYDAFNARITESVKDPIQNLTIHVHPSSIIPQLFKAWKALSPQRRAKLFMVRGRPDNVIVSFIGQRGVGPGVFRTFMQSIVDELHAYKFFVTDPSEKNGRFFINPNLSLSDEFKAKSDLPPVLTEQHYKDLYAFIGHLLVFILISQDVGLTFNLSYAILAHFIYKHDEITDDDYLSYAMLDFPSQFYYLANLMRKPEDIEHAYLTFDDDVAVDTSNFKEFLRFTAKRRLLHHLYPDDDPLAKGSVDTYKRFNALVKGIGSIRKALRVEGRHLIRLHMLDKFVTSSRVTTEIVSSLAKKLNDVMKPHATATSSLGTLVSNMTSIIKDNGETFPWQEIGLTKEPRGQERLKHHLEFIERLLMFWSGFRRFTPSFSYSVSINSVSTLSEQLPRSHTCYFQIEIPEYLVTQRDLLFKKLIQATYFMEEGVGEH